MALFDRFKKSAVTKEAKDKSKSAPKAGPAPAASTSEEKKPAAKTAKPKTETVSQASESASQYAHVLSRPHVSEKAATLADKGIYVFVVPRSANKVEIRKAVEALYGVHVTSVRTQNMKGKRVGMGRRTKGVRKDWKKALVELKKGEQISVIEGV